jgi:hypothetical protein
MSSLGPVAMISSTILALEPQRQAAHTACERQGFEAKMTENNPLVSAIVLEKSLELVDAADVYVLILGFRHGLVPDRHEKILTQLEFTCARSRGIPSVRLLMAGSAESFAADQGIHVGCSLLDTTFRSNDG